MAVASVDVGPAATPDGVVGRKLIIIGGAPFVLVGRVLEAYYVHVAAFFWVDDVLHRRMAGRCVLEEGGFGGTEGYSSSGWWRAVMRRQWWIRRFWSRGINGDGVLRKRLFDRCFRLGLYDER